MRRGKVSKTALLVWHLGALGLLGNIARLAVLAVPSPLQQLAFEQPNVAVLRFPFAWLAAFAVPAVLLSHAAGLMQWLGRNGRSAAIE